MKVKKYQEPSDVLPNQKELDNAGIIAVGPTGKKFYEDFINRYDSRHINKEKLKNVIYNENALFSDQYFSDKDNILGFYDHNRIYVNPENYDNSTFDHELRHKLTEWFPQSSKDRRLLKKAYPLGNLKSGYKTAGITLPFHKWPNVKKSEQFSTNTQLRSSIAEYFGNKYYGDDLTKIIQQLPEDLLYNKLINNGYVNYNDYLSRMSRKDALNKYKNELNGTIYDGLYGSIKWKDRYSMLPERVKNKNAFINHYLNKKLPRAFQKEFRQKFNDNEFQIINSKKINDVRNALINVAKNGGKLIKY